MAVAITARASFVGEREDNPRRLGRADLKVPVQLWSHDEGWAPALLRNLSLGGAFVATPRALPVGARVVVRFSSVDGVESDEIEAQVCWVLGGGLDPAIPVGLGLKFVAPLVQAAIFVRVLLRAREQSR